MQSIFATAPANTTTPPTATEESTTDEDTTKSTTEDESTTDESTTETPKAPVVRMPDGTEVPADTYVKSQVQEEMAKVNSEWEQVRQAALRDAEKSTTETETPASNDPPAWKVEVADDDTFQSDVEKQVVSAHNALGEEVEKIGTRVEESLKRVETQLQTLGETTDRQDAQRQIETIERTKGVTQEEMQAVYDEYNGEVKNLEALATIALSKKTTTEESEKRTEEATNERKEAATTISGGGNSTSTDSGGEQEPGRGLKGKAIYSGEAIAAKYSAFGG